MKTGVGLFGKVGHCREVVAAISFSGAMARVMEACDAVTCSSLATVLKVSIEE
jgi:hypothetical protein